MLTRPVKARDVPRGGYTLARLEPSAPPSSHANHARPGVDGQMNRLDALVAVATSDTQAASNR